LLILNSRVWGDLWWKLWRRGIRSTWGSYPCEFWRRKALKKSGQLNQLDALKVTRSKARERRLVQQLMYLKTSNVWDVIDVQCAGSIIGHSFGSFQIL